MTDNAKAPYDKAIEETAKAAGKAIDLAQSMSPALAELYGLLIGDHVSEYRKRNLDKIGRKTKKILHDRDVQETQPIPEQIAIPLLEAAQGETRSELQDIFAALLANAVDPNFSGDVRVDFLATIRQWHPIEARIMAHAYDHRQSRASGQPKVFDYRELSSSMTERRTKIQLSIDLLKKLDCITINGADVGLSNYGIELMIACSATHGTEEPV
jgi:abortive infection alpha-like protein